MKRPAKTPLVSIIVPNYNHALYLEERLNSIISQTFQDFELIILDDNSNDESVAVILHCLKDHNYQLLVNECNSGSTFLQWDRGIKIAKGEFIWIAESDDVAKPTLLEKLVKQLQNSDTALAYCQSLAINSKSEITGNLKGWTDFISPYLWARDFVMDGTYFAINFMAIKNIIPNASAVLFRKQHYVSPHLLRPDYKLGGDLLLWTRIMEGRSIAYTAEALNHYRFHPGTVRQSQTSSYLRESCGLTAMILEKTHAWDNPGNLTLLREHLATLWFSIGLEPASPFHLWNQREAYQLLYRLHGYSLALLLMRRLPRSLWRLTLPQRIWWQLGLRSLRQKVRRILAS